MKEIDAAIQALEADDSKLWPSEKRTKALAGLRSLKEQEPVPPIYYMRDNHTFKRLSEDTPTALVEIEAEFNAGYTGGMLCSKRDGLRQVHAQGENLRMFFLNACRESLESKEQP